MSNDYIGSLYPSSGGGGGSQVQADWNQSDNTAVDFIKNKPTIPDVWQLRSSVTESALGTSASLHLYKNGAPYEGSGYVWVTYGPDYSNPQNNQTYVNASFNSSGMATISIGNSLIASGARIFTFTVYESSTKAERRVFDKYLIMAQAIADGDGGFATGDQVYDYVASQIGNIETLLASI